MVVGGSSTALAATAHLFDPQLSLTGGCAVDEVDPVADPGCPYPPFPEGPSEPFVRPNGIAVDSYGDLYVDVVAGTQGATEKAHIDVFDPEGRFLTEVSLPEEGPYFSEPDPRTVAVDSKGHLYVYANAVQKRLLRYDPTAYDPAAGEIAYGAAPVSIPLPAGKFSDYAALAVNPENDHLFVNFGTVGSDGPEAWAVEEFGSAEEGSPLLDGEVAEVCCFDGPGLAIDAARGRLYVTDQASYPSDATRIIRVFELAAPHQLIETIDGSSTPEGSFVTNRHLEIAVDEATGHVYAYDEENLNVIYELDEDGNYLSSIQHSLSGRNLGGIVVDNGANSPHGALDPEGRYLWATAAPGGVGHAFAFRPTHECPPTVEAPAASHLGEEDAQLGAEVEPCNLQTTYRFEYTTRRSFEESGFAAAALAGEGTVPVGGVPVAVSSGAAGLAPATAYVFRVVATNALGSDEAQGSFKTYPASQISPADCPNQALRSGPSALLPDCRAYELVSPPDTGGLAPLGAGGIGPLFPALTAAPGGEAVSFRIEGGIIPGAEGTGSLAGDPYLASRGPGGWSTEGTGGRGSEFSGVETGGRSPGQGYSAWRGVANGKQTTFLRFPDGHSELLARGALGTDPAPAVDWIADGGAHVIFNSAARLEEAAPAGKGAVYDRTPEGTKVASLLPGGLPPTEPAGFIGASQDGRGIVFDIDDRLYLRYDGEETYDLGKGVTYEGVAEGGGRVFYLKEGSLYAFDVAAGTIPFATSGDATVVNLSRDGTTAYFVSPSKLTAAPNPLGEKAKAGKENLYRSHEGQIAFVATVTAADVSGEGANTRREGLGLWVKRVMTIGALPADPSRSSRDGGVLLFSSRAPLTGYDNDGHSEVYRYDALAGTLACVSCDPTGQAASADARLQTIGESPEAFPTWVNDRIENLTADGRRAFFETPEALLAADVDGHRDVYEWEAGGEGSCAPGEAQGCLYLLTSGRSAHEDYLYGVSEDGGDVFVLSNDRLQPAEDPSEAISIYDARVGGGFAHPSGAAECQGEACQPAASPPERPAQALGGSGNVLRPKPRCPKGRRAVSRGGRRHCVKRRHRHGHSRPRHHRR